MNVLYIAYSCAPNSGSENKIGWQIPLGSAGKNKVFVITKAEHRSVIEAYLKAHRECKIQFSFVDIPGGYKKLLKGPLYSGRLNLWHRRALPVAKRLCMENDIHLIHQITPVEFRSIGAYDKIPNVKFVCGPLGGAEETPKGLKTYTRCHPSEWIRAAINRWYRFRYCHGSVLERCDHVMFANEETKLFLRENRGEVLSEIAIDMPETPTPSEKKTQPCVFLVAGRMIYRKGHRFLLDALEQLPRELAYTCRIVGAGPEEKKLQKLVKKRGLSESVTFVGKISHGEMTKEYANAHVLIMPSLRETTGSVLLEAMSHGLPVITIRRFGGAVLLNDNNSWLYDGNTKKEYIQNLKSVLEVCISDPGQVQSKSAAARVAAENNGWEQKVLRYQQIYQSFWNEPKE